MKKPQLYINSDFSMTTYIDLLYGPVPVTFSSTLLLHCLARLRINLLYYHLDLLILSQCTQSCIMLGTWAPTAYIFSTQYPV